MQIKSVSSSVWPRKGFYVQNTRCYINSLSLKKGPTMFQSDGMIGCQVEKSVILDEILNTPQKR